MRIGLMADLHIGGSGSGCWHNRLLHGTTAKIVESAVNQLNGLRPDRVLVLGDIANCGSVDDLRQARRLLDRLQAPWRVVPGNHDRPGVASGAFDAVFGEHAMPAYARWDDVGILLLRETVPSAMSDAGYILDDGACAAACRCIEANPPATLIVASHFPLVSEESVAEKHGGKYAGHLTRGDALVARLRAACSMPVVVLCGHNHWHRMTALSWGLQVATASLFEWPLECRIVTLEAERLTVTTPATASPEYAEQSLLSARWVAGEPEDREGVFPLPTGRICAPSSQGSRVRQDPVRSRGNPSA